MSMLRDLKKGLGDLPDEELTQLITKMRAERRNSTRSLQPAKPRQTAKSKEAKLTIAMLTLDSLSESDLDELSALLGDDL